MPSKADAPTGQPQGRPSLLTAKRIEAVLTAIERGNFTETAATLAGVSKSTYNKWKRRGENEIRRVNQLDPNNDAGEIVDQFLSENLDEDQPFRDLPNLLNNSWADPVFDTNEWPYVIFATLLARSRAKFIDSTITDIARIAKGSATSSANWTAYKWLLQMTQPDLYGDRKTLVHEGGETPVAFEQVSPEQLAERITLLKQQKEQQ